MQVKNIGVNVRNLITIFWRRIGHPDYIDENITLIDAANNLSRAKGLNII